MLSCLIPHKCRSLTSIMTVHQMVAPCGIYIRKCATNLFQILYFIYKTTRLSL